MEKKLKDWLPHEFFCEYMNTKAATLLEYDVVKEYNSDVQGFFDCPIKTHKNIFNWVEVTNGIKTYAVAWNENPSKGWSFPVKIIKKN